jgi:hypothetical protein
MKRCHWLKPALVAQVKFTEWTLDGQLRQPVFLGLRTDKEAERSFVKRTNAMTLRFRLAFVGPVAAVLSGISLPIFAGAGELFRYRLRANDGRQFEYVFESSEQPSSRSITREQAIRNATDWMATVHHLQLGSIENAEFRDKPFPYWLVCFADPASGPIQHLLFAVVLADGRIVQPKVSERL